MRIAKMIAVLAVLALASCNAPRPTGSGDQTAEQRGQAAAPGQPGLDSDEAKTLYALGLDIASNVEVFALSAADVELVKQGLTDGVTGATPKVELSSYGPKIGDLARSRAEARAKDEAARSKEFVAQAAQEPGAVKTESGLVYRELAAGNGESPAAQDTVKVHYRGTLVNGKEFDSSYKRNEPTEFPLNGVIPCWTEGIQQMKVGGKGKLVCPPELAYGESGRPGIPGGAALIFEVELLGVQKAGAPAADDAAQQPAAAPPAGQAQ
ncbi:MAG: FKBP-type peptidyl-prolyl cis-trans isomerase [Deltaproteobacteria bacterium]|nr:FKBP-type peptidyl-prolyl cis-trans isomerase [Deltaproteobacteria bacterium]